MRKLEIARSTDYEVGLAVVPPELLTEMRLLLERVVLEIEKTATGNLQPGSRSLEKAR